MNIFQTIAGILGENDDVTIVVTKRAGGRLAVSTNFRNRAVTDKARDLIAPFLVSGTPEELDAEYCGIIAEPLEQSSGIQTSMANFEASKKLAQTKSQQAAATKSKAENERGADGSIFGATFADRRTRTAYKASELGDGVSVSLFREADGVTGGRWASDEASGQEEVGGKKDIGHDESVAGRILEAALEMSEGTGGSGALDPQAQPDKRRKRRKPRYTS